MKTALLVAVVASLLSPNAQAGWISGGTGELRGDSGNPWFLDVAEQRGTITYCIDADEAAMGISIAHIRSAVRVALDFWKVQIPSAHYPKTDDLPAVNVKSGPFVESVDLCDDTIDVVFQLGRIGTAAQRELIEEQQIDLRQYIGFATRLSYDRNLKGKGFIYIAPENGPLRPTGNRLMGRFWSEDGEAYRLTAVLAHEIGHIFGLSHFGDEEQLMGQDFPEHVVTEQFGAHFLTWRFRNVFRVGDSILFERCFTEETSSDLQVVFGLKAQDRCLRLRLSGNELLISARDDSLFPWRAVAKMILDKSTHRERYHEVSRLWFPSERDIFRNVPDYVKSLKGPSAVETMASGLLISFEGDTSRPAVLTIDPLRTQIGVSINGKFLPDVLDGLTSGWQHPANIKRQ